MDTILFILDLAWQMIVGFITGASFVFFLFFIVTENKLITYNKAWSFAALTIFGYLSYISYG